LTPITVNTGSTLAVPMHNASSFATLDIYKAKCTGDYRMTFENLVGTNPSGGTFTDLGEVGNFVT
jgi:hypothetical protein